MKPSAPRRKPKKAMTTAMTECARSILIACVLAIAWTGSALAHPYHVAFLEAEANPETQRLEVAMRIFPEDLA